MRHTTQSQPFRPQQLPEPGERVHCALQGMHYTDGVVLTVLENGFGAKAIVLTDEGTTEWVSGLRTEPGIGWHRGLSPARRWVQAARNKAA